MDSAGLTFQTDPMLSSEPLTAAPHEVSVDVSYDYAQEDHANIIQPPGTCKTPDNFLIPLFGFILSFLFPPAGCIVFCMFLGAPDNSGRYRWAIRALYLGSLLSFLYSLGITMIVSELYLAKSDSDLLYGYSYDG
eukprot:GHVS01028201.1.p1 GENE.GHVS01028201.1~~GHVS01028201.1.p1  ORF type:complete len:135 (+),score=15.62 GHVS01028201.1:223-627(+)